MCCGHLDSEDLGREFCGKTCLKMGKAERLKVFIQVAG